MSYLYMFRQLWQYTDNERWKVVIFLFLHTVATLGELGKPYAFAMVMNALQNNQPTLIHDVLFWLLFYISCFFVFEVFHRSGRYLERYVAFRNRRRFVASMYNQLQSLPLDWHADHHSGAVIDRINKSADAIHEFSERQFIYIPVLVNIWGPFIILWQISPMVPMIAVPVGFMMIFVTRELYNLQVPEHRATNETLHRVAATLHDYISNIRTIITLRLGQYARQDILSRLDMVFPHIKKENNITHIKCFVNQFSLLMVETGLVFYYVFAQHSAGNIIMIGSVTAIFQYLKQMMDSFLFYAGDYESVINWKIDFEAIKPIIDMPTTKTRSIKKIPAEWNSLKIHSLNFSYKNGVSGLQDISLDLTKDSKIAIVGESGAGKSSLLQVLRGLLPASGGELVIDSGKTMPIFFLSNVTTLIPQDPEIIENTIKYNITMGMSASDEALWPALKISGFDEVAERLPRQLESDIREKGVNLSGGEKQRLSLARGVFAIKDSSIILLDEPTASIDPATELKIFHRLLQFLSDKCMLCALHRLHIVRFFDYVYVLSKGKIVEAGTFEALCEKQGEFSRLWEKYMTENSAI